MRKAIPMIDVKVPLAAGSTSAATAVITYVGALGEMVRGDNLGRWRTSRPRWTLTSAWLPDAAPPWPSADSHRELVGRWLRVSGPGTTEDLAWWLGGTKAVLKKAPAELGAVTVSLDGA